MLGSFITKLATHEVRMDDIASHLVVPGAMADVQHGPSHDIAEGDHPRLAVPEDQDQFHGMEEHVHCRVAKCFRGALKGSTVQPLMMTQELTMRH